MTSKAFGAGVNKFYIVDSLICTECGKVKLEYAGCVCEDAKCDTLRDKVRLQRDVLIASLGHVNCSDIYLQGLVRGQLTAYEKVLEMIGGDND